MFARRHPASIDAHSAPCTASANYRRGLRVPPPKPQPHPMQRRACWRRTIVCFSSNRPSRRPFLWPDYGVTLTPKQDDSPIRQSIVCLTKPLNIVPHYASAAPQRQASAADCLFPARAPQKFIRTTKVQPPTDHKQQVRQPIQCPHHLLRPPPPPGVPPPRIHHPPPPPPRPPHHRACQMRVRRAGAATR